MGIFSKAARIASFQTAAEEGAAPDFGWVCFEEASDLAPIPLPSLVLPANTEQPARKGKEAIRADALKTMGLKRGSIHYTCNTSQARASEGGKDFRSDRD
jgi:hypothetical protein